MKNKGFDVPKAKPADTALGKAIIKKKCTPEQANRYAVLFNTAYAEVMTNGPTIDQFHAGKYIDHWFTNSVLHTSLQWT